MKEPLPPADVEIPRTQQYIARQEVEGNVLNFFADPDLLRRLFGQPEPPKQRRIAVVDYLQYLHDRHRYADFKGMGFVNRVPLRLELADLYVPLRGRRQLPEGETLSRETLRRETLTLEELTAGRSLPEEDRAILGERPGQLVPVRELFQRHAGLVIVGDPGSGKTTFLKHLAVQAATGQESQRGFPVLLPLSAYANAIESQDLPLQHFIPSHLERECGVDIREEFERALESGVALVMLDGLDEVKDPSLRQTVVRCVERFFDLYRRRGNKFVLTSRIIGYREVRPTAGDLAECTLDYFDTADIEAFVDRWTRALEQEAHGDNEVARRDAERERAEMLEVIRRQANVRRLAANPMLLTILALMKREAISLPERRVELYETCVQSLVSSWNRARGLGRAISPDFGPPKETQRTLAQLALWMHEANPGVGLVPMPRLLDQVSRQFLQAKIRPRAVEQATPEEEAEAESTAARFLADVRDHTGVIVELATGRYGFIHQTFEEYLAAVGLALRGQKGAEPIFAAIRPHLHDPAWREVILLTVGYLGLVQGRDEVASDLVDAILAADSEPPGLAVLLAGDATHDACPSGGAAHGVTEACRTKVVRALRSTMADDRRVSAALRARAGATLGELGDDRRGVAPRSLRDLEEMEFCFVPPGTFRMGEDRRLTPRHSLDDCGYWIARFPVTAGQYRLFVLDQGYAQSEWWVEAQAAGHWKNGMLFGWGFSPVDNRWRDEWRDRPAESGVPFRLPNHPVVDVNWYEAMAFCRWLSARHSPRSGRFGLPTEVQREKAARGGEQVPTSPLLRRLGHGFAAPHDIELTENPHPGRVYPWAGPLEADRLNSKETGIRSTSAVGCFPSAASPYGAEELSGNVWEWCHDRYGGDGDWRVLRGGSWLDDFPGNLSCGSRNYGHPVARADNYGFRCVWVCDPAT